MARLIKILLIIIASFIGLIVTLSIILPLIINPNDYKPEIQDAVKNSTGRDLKIEGELELSVFPWIGLSTGKLTLSNATGFADKAFAEIEQSDVKVKLLPLISKELQVSRITLKGLTLNLAKNKQGLSNWDDLSGKPSSKTTTDDTTEDNDQSVSPLAALAIGGIAIEQAKISWDDQQQGKYIEINDFNLNSEALSFDKPIAIELSLSIYNQDPELTESISLSTELSINQALDNFTLADLKLESSTQGKSIPGETLTAQLTTDIALDLTQQTLGINQLKLSSGELNILADIKGKNIKDQPVFTGPIKIEAFSPAKLMTQLAIALPKRKDNSTLSHLSADFILQAGTASAAIQQLSIKLDDTSIKGEAAIKNFTNPAINFNLNIDNIDVDRYLPPKEAGQSNKKIATPAAAAASAALLPVESLRALNATGLLSIQQLKINQLKMQGLSLKLDAKNGLIRSKQNIKQLYQGTYSGNTTINVKNKTPALAFNEKLSKVNMEPLLKDMLGEARMSGMVNANAQVQAYGNSTKRLKSSLSGQLNFNFSNGLIRGFNLQKIIDNGKALIEGTPLPTENKKDQTVFSVIKGSARIKKGLISNNDLYAEASKLRVNGQGTANLATDKLDYKIKAKLLKTVATNNQPEKIKGLPVIFNITGPLSKPSYQLDIPAMLLEKNKAKIDKKKDELLKKLDEKIGPGVSDLLKSFL